jgi:crossover junction endodeoxyribonuclease RusA
MLISEKGRAYRDLILWALYTHYPSIIIGCTPIRFNISMDILMYPPDNRRRDTDNILKCLWDSLQHAGLYEDDYQIKKHSVERMGMIKNGKVSILMNKII